MTRRVLSLADEMAIEALPPETRRVLAHYLADAFEAGYRKGYGRSQGATPPEDTHVRPARREYTEQALPRVLRMEAA